MKQEISAMLLCRSFQKRRRPSCCRHDHFAAKLHRGSSSKRLFEKLAASNPKDPAVIETYGLLMLTEAISIQDPAARKQARARAREILVGAEKLGANSVLLKTSLASVPADGGESASFSSKKEIDEAMREGEGAFARGDYPKAIEMYQRALLLDPTLYEAALFTGDVYFKTADQVKAAEWLERAIDQSRS
jgi:tetratricopeptide (TPR) repeat protein